MSHSFAMQKIIIQRKEKISILEKTLQRTISPDAIESIKSQINDQKKDLKYFENTEAVI